MVNNSFVLGINSNNEAGNDFKEILQNVKEAGFEAVMIANKAGCFEDAIKEAKRLGLQIPYVHLSTNHPQDIWAVGASNEAYVDNILAEIAICGKYEVPIAVMHPTDGSPSDIPLSPNQNGLKCFEKIVDFAKKNNVKIALENLDKCSVKYLDYLFSNIKSYYLGFCYDAGHHNLYLPNVNLLKRFEDRLLAIHLHDNLMDYQFGCDYTRDLHRLPFDGKINFAKVCKNLAKTDYDNVIMLELHKNSCGKPKLYLDWTDKKFLKEAFARCQKLAEMVENFK